MTEAYARHALAACTLSSAAKSSGKKGDGGLDRPPRISHGSSSGHDVLLTLRPLMTHCCGRQVASSLSATSANRFFNEQPTIVIDALMATAMPAATRPYSIAVAPDWSLINLTKALLIKSTPGIGGPASARQRLMRLEICMALRAALASLAVIGSRADKGRSSQASSSSTLVMRAIGTSIRFTWMDHAFIQPNFG